MKFSITVLFYIFFSGSISAKSQYIRVVFNTDASNSAAIGWDQPNGTCPLVWFSKDSLFSNKLELKPSVDKKNRGMHTHFVRLTELVPNTRYYFKIVDNEGETTRYFFSTVPNVPTERLAFIAGGDSRDGRDVRVQGNKIVAKVHAHAVFFNGDFTGIDIESQWRDWFEDWSYATSPEGRITPLVVTRGNHERDNDVIEDLFDVPSAKITYDVVFGGTLLNVICLNSEILKFGAQERFLKRSLKEHADFNWQIPQYHRPIRSHVAHKKEMETEYRHFVPNFEKYKNVRLCLENDSHTCKTTWPIVSSTDEQSAEGFKRDDANGIVYVGEGCWGAPLRKADDAKPWTRDCAAINQVNWIFVDQSKIEVRTIEYMNADVVGTLTEANRFDMPTNIAIWNPSNGSVIEILPRRN
jgi:acid phosphatase type 7